MKKALVVGFVILCILALLLLVPLPLGATRVYSATVIQRPPDEVFNYVTTPGNWPRWHPSSLAVSGATDHSLALGEQVTEDFSVAGVTGRALWTVTLRQAPQQWAIDGKVEGGGSGRVTYKLTPDAHGTKFERELVYSSNNLLFVIVNTLKLRSRIEAESADALRRLKSVMEQG